MIVKKLVERFRMIEISHIIRIVDVTLLLQITDKVYLFNVCVLVCLLIDINGTKNE